MRKYLIPYLTFNENLKTVPTIRAICFHDDFYSLGWDH
jgi:hypothetical protein